MRNAIVFPDAEPDLKKLNRKKFKYAAPSVLLVLIESIVRIKVFAKSFEAADRLTSQLASSEAFETAQVDGEVKASRKRGGKTFNVTIPLPVPGEES